MLLTVLLTANRASLRREEEKKEGQKKDFFCVATRGSGIASKLWRRSTMHQYVHVAADINRSGQIKIEEENEEKKLNEHNRGLPSALGENYEEFTDTQLPLAYN